MDVGIPVGVPVIGVLVGLWLGLSVGYLPEGSSGSVVGPPVGELVLGAPETVVHEQEEDGQ